MYTNMHLPNNDQSMTNRSYGFKELAVLYFPNIAPASASIRLKQWIKDDAELLEALLETNYELSNRILTPRQKELITTSFGSPFKPQRSNSHGYSPNHSARGTPSGKGEEHFPPTSVSPKGGRKGGRTRIHN